MQETKVTKENEELMPEMEIGNSKEEQSIESKLGGSYDQGKLPNRKEDDEKLPSLFSPRRHLKSRLSQAGGNPGVGLDFGDLMDRTSPAAVEAT
jgi:hypothetical protein